MRLAASLTFLSLSTFTLSCAPGGTPGSPSLAAERPALMVLVVVDQLRSDLVDRYGDLWTGGFRRLREHGYVYVNASQAHAATETAVGHATLSTGSYPNHHGIIGNSWYETVGNQWKSVSNVGDSTVGIVGHPGRPGVSPIHLMRPGLAEWITAADRRSIVASVSGKDRGAIQPAAHSPGGYVYWFDPAVGEYVTSTYYRSGNPDWLTRFNAGALQSHRADTVWDLRVPTQALPRANPDAIATEGDGVNTTFPHRFAVEGNPRAFWAWWAGTPYQDLATIALAKTMVTSLGLGTDAAPDFLNVSLSATDYVGHAYGPLSREQLDNLLRLDRVLGDFFAFLDREVGAGRWAMMLSADHGVLDSPEDLVARGEYGHRATPTELAAFEQLRQEAIRTADRTAGARKLAADLKQSGLVIETYTHESLLIGQPRDSFEVLERRSIYPGRVSGPFSREGVEVRFKQGMLRSARGSSHGTPWWHDRHVPMIFMGAGIRAARDTSRAETVDFAPTAAALLGVPIPDGVDGRVLPGIVRPR